MLSIRGLITFLIVISFISSTYTEVFVHRSYEDEKTVEDWIKSDKKPDTAGALELKTMKLLPDPTRRSLYTGQTGKFYHYSLPIEKPVSTIDNDLAFQFALTHEDGISCGGGYLKLLTENDPKNFDGETPYAIMFGPDVCGPNGRIHLIFNIEGKNVLKTDDIPYTADKLTHIYTLVVRANKTYEVYKDCKSIDSGSIGEKWDFQLPKEISDPDDKKPNDWVDAEMMDDPADVKPEDWDKPEFIDDPNATKPAEWDDETDGEFVANKIPNPDFKGVWKPKKIKNPNYQGVWKAKKIPNPDFKEITTYAEYANIQAIGYDIWAVDAHSHLSHVMLSNDSVAVLAECEKILPIFAEYNSKVEEAKKKEDEEMAKQAKAAAEEEASKKPASETDEEDDDDSDSGADADKPAEHEKDEL